MKCIYCDNTKTEITNSRPFQNGEQTWRRRYCPNCDRTFTTKESAVADNLFIIKRNGTRQRFIYEKLLVSVFAVLNSGKNSDNGDNAKIAKKIAEDTIKEILLDIGQNRDVKSSLVIELVFSQLKKVGQMFADQYIYYSRYRREVARKAKLTN